MSPRLIMTVPDALKRIDEIDREREALVRFIAANTLPVIEGSANQSGLPSPDNNSNPRPSLATPVTERNLDPASVMVEEDGRGAPFAHGKTPSEHAGSS